MTKRKNTFSNRKKVAFSLLSGFILLGCLWGLDKANVIDVPFLAKENVSDSSTPEEIDYGPPTEEEKNETEKFKDELGTQNSTPPNNTTPSQKKTVSVVVTSWGQPSDVEVSGYVSGIYESGGTCTATAERNGQKVSASRQATLNAQNISCGFIAIPRSQLNAGTWNLTLSYSSTSAEGTSQSVPWDVK